MTFALRDGVLLQNSSFGEALAAADETLQAQLGLPAGQGLVVTGVTPGSPAETLGLRKDDILIAIAEKPLESATDFDARVRAVEKAAELKLVRGGKRIVINLEPAAQTPEGQREYYLGIPVAAVNGVLRAHLEIPEGQGLVVEQVLPDSPAARGGLERNDILLSIGGHPVGDVKVLRERVQASAGKPLSLAVLRHAKPMTIGITPEKRQLTYTLKEFPVAQSAKPSEDQSRTPFGLSFIGPGVVVKDPNGGNRLIASGNAPMEPGKANSVVDLAFPTQGLPQIRWVTVPAPPKADEAMRKRLDEVITQLNAQTALLEELKASLVKEAKEAGDGK